MSDNHQHAPQVMQPQQRRPNDQRIIARLNTSLDERANEIRRLQDQLVFFQSLCDELQDESAGKSAALDQVSAENRLLRKRLGLPEVGAIELTDDEADALPVEMVAEEPDAVVHPHVEEPIIDAEIVEQGTGERDS